MCGTSPVLSVKATDSVLDAFKLMAVNDITGVAVRLMLTFAIAYENVLPRGDGTDCR